MDRSLLQIVTDRCRPCVGQTLLVGVSGGVDSVVLLHLLSRLRDAFRLTLHAAHLDHSIREQSGTDAVFVADLCKALNVPLQMDICDIPSRAKKQKVSIEMAARDARREFLMRQAADCGATHIALAHHRDDQAETFLLRLLRGTGPAGLAAMAMCDGLWWRPLLECGRDVILHYAADHRLQWREDESNQQLCYTRNRIRHQLLPLLRQFNPRIAEHLATLSAQQGQDEQFWQATVSESLEDVILSRDDGMRLDCGRLLDLPPALKIRVLRAAIAEIRGGLQRITATHLCSVDDLLSRSKSQAEIGLPEIWVARRYGQLWLRRKKPDCPPFELALDEPGEVALPGGSILRATLAKRSRGETRCCVEFDADQLLWPLQIRSFRAGDRFGPSGLDGTKKLKDFFIDNKLEHEHRRQVPLVLSGGQILWVAGVRRSALAPALERTRSILRFELILP